MKKRKRPPSLVELRAHPDETVVDLLERVLAAAKRGEVQSIALVTESPGREYGSAATTPLNRFAVLGNLVHLQHQIESRIER